jgi:glycosyltransferase involved in cell wall biosynthesis
VQNKQTGFLCESAAVAFSEAMLYLVNNKSDAAKFGQAGKRVVLDRFTMDAFASELDQVAKSVLRG